MTENTKPNPKDKDSESQLDPRQKLFLANYMDPKSKTFANAYQSARDAEYSEEYAKNLTGQMPEWLSENISDSRLIKKAEQNLWEMLDMDTVVMILSADGVEIPKDDPQMKRIKADMTKFALERLNKAKYSQRQEHTGKDGEPIETVEVKIIRGTDDNPIS